MVEVATVIGQLIGKRVVGELKECFKKTFSASWVGGYEFDQSTSHKKVQ